MKPQIPPLAIQIELTEGCNLGCSFCGLRGIREDGKKPWKFMSRDTAIRITDEIAKSGWRSRVIFSMHGEPTLNPNAQRIIKLFRKRLPKAVFSMMCNGYGIVHDLDTGDEKSREDIRASVESYKASGLNDLIVDYYSLKGDASLIQGAVEETDEYFIQTLQPKVPLYSHSAKKFRILFNPPIQKEVAINRHLCNHCGAAAPLDFSYQNKRCARPFRELSIRWDGGVALCCNDFRGEYPIGNVCEKPIAEVWHSKRFSAARILLYAGNRTFKPCLGCNALSHRVGLLPDRMGKDTLPKPSYTVLSFAETVSNSNEPLCGKIIKREWEK